MQITTKIGAFLTIIYGLLAQGFSLPSNGIPDIRDEFMNHTIALELAKLSRAVYSTNATYFDSIPSKYKVIGWIDEGSTEVLIIQVKQNSFEQPEIKADITVVFRGTEETTDWIVNVQTEMVPFGFPDHIVSVDMPFPSINDQSKDKKVPILVHKGFNQVFRIYEQILEYLSPLSYETLSVTGHSLGGANAQLFATMYAFQNPHISVNCATYGQPRTGNIGFKAFVESIYNLNMWRFVNQDDIVPRVPSFLMDFTHAGHLMWKQKEQETIAVSAYYRQVGSHLKGKNGVNDFSLALLGPIQGNEVNTFVQHHLIKSIVDDWLTNPNMYTLEFE